MSGSKLVVGVVVIFFVGWHVIGQRRNYKTRELYRIPYEPGYML